MRGCCICESSKNSKLYEKVGDYTLLKCNKCSLVYLKEIFENNNFIQQASEDLSKKHTEKVEFWSFPELYEKHKNIFNSFFEERLERLKSFQPIHSLFDIGCGYGFWMNYCKNNGICTEGIDVSKEAVKYANVKFNLKVSLSRLENYNFDRCFDTFTMMDVIEHLEDPNEQLSKIYDAMNDISLLMIQAPNVLGLTFPGNHGYGLPFHIWQFDLNTITRLMEKNGFSLIRYYTGIQGIIGLCEENRYKLLRKILYSIINRLKVGNRLILLFRRSSLKDK